MPHLVVGPRGCVWRTTQMLVCSPECQENCVSLSLQASSVESPLVVRLEFQRNIRIAQKYLVPLVQPTCLHSAHGTVRPITCRAPQCLGHGSIHYLWWITCPRHSVRDTSERPRPLRRLASSLSNRKTCKVRTISCASKQVLSGKQLSVQHLGIIPIL